MSANILEQVTLDPTVALLRPGPAARNAATRQQIRDLYVRHQPQVRRLVSLYYRGNTGAAEDIAQDVFVTLCEEFDRLDKSRPLEGWFSRVTINRCRSRRRRDVVATTYVTRTREASRPDTPPEADPETVTTRHLTLEHVSGLMHRLPATQQQVLRSYHFDGERQVDIGSRLGISKSYVCKLLKTAVENLRQEIGEGEALPSSMATARH
ncbi:MAG: sigma-70 family RNA polymerase sigma factor [Deltaproteobacteria bacterium]|nr:sigma-70 family RNA polymerase sigma factor [Deltaproteobacteria bacterium]